MEKNESRVIYFDYLRVFATFAVMLLHIVATNWGTVDVNGFDWKVFNFYDSLVRWSVPVFVMISGALFLRRDISIPRIYKKYVLRMAVAFITWSLVYYFMSGESIGAQFLGLFQIGKAQGQLSIITGHYHMWFLPMIAGVYMCIPIIRKIVEDKQICRYYLLLSFLFGFLVPLMINLASDFAPERVKMIVTAIKSDISAMDMRMVLGFPFYFILGYYLSTIEFHRKTRATIYSLGLLGFAFTMIVDYVITIKAQVATGTYYDYFSLNVLLEAAAVFELFKNLSFRKETINRWMKRLSKWSFGAFLVHVLWIEKLNGVWGIDALSMPVPTCLSVIIVALLVFVLSFGVSVILNSIPVLRKYIV